MCSFDQLDVPNISAAEAVVRRLQAIEWQYRERVRETSRSQVVASAGVAGAPALTSSEMDLFEGSAKVNATLMVSPQLIKYIAEESKSEADVSKASRKAREERLLAQSGFQDAAALASAVTGGGGDNGGDDTGKGGGGRRRGKKS